ncbi:MAG: CoA transferase [Acidobacteria bacterium]|nr:CoA transferase [Acidobacteriota bacterium]
MDGPIEGLRVLDCSTGAAGPRATGMLADYGADVVWVEQPGGDPYRRREPWAASVFNRGKRSVTLDLDDPSGVAAALALADRADVFVESWPPGTADRLGMGFDVLHARNPALVYVSISGFGESGRDADLPAEEPIVHALVGTMTSQAAHRPGPAFIGFPCASLGAAYLANIGALAAIHRRDSDGAGRHVHTSLFDGALAYNSMMWGETDQSVAAEATAAASATPVRVGRGLMGSFLCSDGAYFSTHTGAVGAFGRAMKALGFDDRIPPSDTGHDLGVPLSPEQVPILREDIPALFKTKPRDEWVDLLLDADVCVVPNLMPTESFDTPQVVHDGLVVELDDPVLGLVRQVGPAARFAATPARVRGPAPTPGQHTDAVRASHAGWPQPVRPDGVPTADTRPLLDGVRILDIGAYYAGPYSSRLLADLGADVIKLEPYLGDQLRGIERPFFSAQAKKRAIAANLKDPSTLRLARGLVEWADIIHHNLRPGADARLGLDYETSRLLNPSVIYEHAAGWGPDGPYALRQSFAPMQAAYTGVSFETGGRGNPPLAPFANEDPGNGLLGAMAMLMALLHRTRTGQAQFIANTQVAAAMTHLAHIVRRPDGQVVGAGRLDGEQMGLGPFERLYRAADGAMVCVVAHDDAGREAAAAALGAAHVEDDEAQVAVLAAAVATREANDVVRMLRAAGVAAAVPDGHTNHTTMNDPEQRRLGRVAELSHPVKGKVREVDTLVRVSDSERVPHRLAPELGEHTDEILRQVGYTDAEITQLRDRNVAR